MLNYKRKELESIEKYLSVLKQRCTVEQICELKPLVELIHHNIVGAEGIEKILEGKFENKSDVMNWENYIPNEIKEIWKNLLDNAKLCCYYFAAKQANEEDWDD